MDTTSKENATTSQKLKLNEIQTFCLTSGYTVNDVVERIAEKIDLLQDNSRSFLDALWKSIKVVEIGSGKEILLEAVKILSRSSSLFKFTLKNKDVQKEFVLLVVFFLKIIFKKIDMKQILKPSNKPNNVIFHELAGLAERISTTAIFIEAVDVKKHLRESSLRDLISSVDLHIGVDQIGNLKSRISTLMSGGSDDWLTCIQLLTMLVKISTLRHCLLYRMMACLKINHYSQGTINALQRFIEKERMDNQKFMSFFSAPTIKNVGIISVFDPSEQKEIVTYVQGVGLSFYDLSSVLNGHIFLARPIKNSSLLVGRPFLAFGSLGVMKTSTDTRNVRIRFKFTAVEDSFNLFFIQSPDLDEYIFMKENRECKYKRMASVQDDAKWRVIPVYEENKKEKQSTNFILCTKKWPERFLHLENSFFPSVKGLPDNVNPCADCLFMVNCHLPYLNNNNIIYFIQLSFTVLL